MTETSYLSVENTTRVNSPQEQLVHEALLLLGTKSIPYKGVDHGINPKEGFDCSGFVTYLLTKINFPKDEDIRHCNEYFDEFGVLVHRGLQKRGDLIFFSNRGSYPSHIGIMTGKTEYIHAPGKDDASVVEIQKLEYDAIPMEPDQIYNVNPIGFKRLAISTGRWKKIN